MPKKKITAAYALAVIFITITVITATHEAGHYIVAKRNGVKIIAVSCGFGPRILTMQRNGTTYSISAIPLGGYVSMAGENDMPTPRRKAGARTFNSQPDKVRLRILLAGPLVNILTGTILILILRPPTRKKQGTEIAEVINDSPAARAGLAEGDKITAINDQQVTTAMDIHTCLRRLPCTQTTIAVVRAGQQQRLAIQPDPAKGLSPLYFPTTIPHLGIRLSAKLIDARHTIKRGPGRALTAMIATIALPISVTLAIIKGHIRITNLIIGPIGLFYMVRSLMASGKATALELFAMISLSVGFTNALPIPVLDGGRTAMILAEESMKNPMSQAVTNATNFTGATFLIFLAVFVMIADISKIRKARKQGSDPFDISQEPII